MRPCARATTSLSLCFAHRPISLPILDSVACSKVNFSPSTCSNNVDMAGTSSASKASMRPCFKARSSSTTPSDCGGAASTPPAAGSSEGCAATGAAARAYRLGSRGATSSANSAISASSTPVDSINRRWISWTSLAQRARVSAASESPAAASSAAAASCALAQLLISIPTWSFIFSLSMASATSSLSRSTASISSRSCRARSPSSWLSFCAATASSTFCE
mmetsp:Transcript_78912/g.174777  ORF Transcript_78912/g.174777 Transcript_78912/m.174777 type:complete len:220 (+) Transcript_78912:74-733(+)